MYNGVVGAADNHAAGLRGGVVAAVARTLKRIEADRSRAVVTTCPEALEIARQVERMGEPGLLAGTPFTAKDVLATAGTLSQAGSRVLAGNVPRQDAPAIALLRAAGAVLVGKTNCSELALTPWTATTCLARPGTRSCPAAPPEGRVAAAPPRSRPAWCR
jgi:Asp-tRNA(Asn)/Glu-tRNA(Gln) amidotransferase A subunit family amidase